MKEIRIVVAPVLRISLVFMILCGLVYPFIFTGVAQTLMPVKADGSLIKDKVGTIVGSELIGQQVSDPAYFQGRVSSIEYNGSGSGSNNYAPSNPDLEKRLENSIDKWKKDNPTVPIAEVPSELLTNSGSGLDPHITPKGAEVQVDRISDKGGISKSVLRKLIKEHTDGKELGFFGQEKVNVLKLNLALNELYK
ncbi:potassium-transporting ATPase subunit KdpC [Bacillus sp. 1P06AnD]|uniref:potassium-transporting ATPase subunit KdpC n=1 Tax=Bacillus sp. 1P06AnD TaxID=3132208 RepID=UPI0039A1A46A